MVNDLEQKVQESGVVENKKGTMEHYLATAYDLAKLGVYLGLIGLGGYAGYYIGKHSGIQEGAMDGAFLGAILVGLFVNMHLDDKNGIYGPDDGFPAP